MTDNPTPKLYAEAVGTFALTFVGAGAIWVTGDDLLAVATAHGIILAVMVTATIAIIYIYMHLYMYVCMTPGGKKGD